jgi:hypothetical protein
MASGAVAELDPSASRSPGATPTFVLSASERAVHTRAASADAQRRQRYLREVTLQYSLCHEPWTKYTVAAVADRGLKRAQWTSARLRNEVLYLETQRARFELTWEGLTGPAGVTEASASASAMELSGADGALDAFRWARCRTPLPLEAARAAGAPLRVADVEVRTRTHARMQTWHNSAPPALHQPWLTAPPFRSRFVAVQVLARSVAWESIKWGSTGARKQQLIHGGRLRRHARTCCAAVTHTRITRCTHAHDAHLSRCCHAALASRCARSLPLSQA